MFESWRKARNQASFNDHSLSAICPGVEIEQFSDDELNFAVSRFICEINKKTGSNFPGKTLKELVICLQMYLEKKGRVVRFFIDPMFRQITNTLDKLMKERAEKGIGLKVKQAQVITVEEEETLFSTGVLGLDTPLRLLRLLFYLVGLRFALRAGREHHNLRCGEFGQFNLMTDVDGIEYLQYTEGFSKANQGGLKHCKVNAKSVSAYPTADKRKCIVTVYKKYMSLCPSPRPAKFYLQALKKPTDDQWFGNAVVGIHTLEKMVSQMCKEAGIEGYKTNHSLRATAATRLYEAGLDEQLITEVTGHRSLSVRSYKRTTTAQKRHISSVLAGPSKRSCPETVSVAPVQVLNDMQNAMASATPVSQSVNSVNLPCVGLPSGALSLTFNINVAK